MATNRIDGLMYKTMVTNGATLLRNNYKEIDALNVFPVPDGDTGTNMRMTIEGGVKEISSFEEKSIYLMAKQLSRGMLMGARGNSGVILSQLFRGIYKGFAGCEQAGAFELARAFKSGVEQAYKAVMKPVEGTVLTVAREASEVAMQKLTKKSTILSYLEDYIEEAEASLKRTPDLLPALKDANVVDSGAAGFLYVVKGMKLAVEGVIVAPVEQSLSMEATVTKGTFNAHSELTYGYCTEFILQLLHKKVDIVNFDHSVIAKYLETVGDSIVCVRDEDIVKVHVHTKTPGDVLAHCQAYGEFITLKIENMSVQHSETIQEPEECNCDACVEMRKSATKKKYAVVAVASGEGLMELFKNMGVDYVVSGGQSMNPSASDFVEGFDTLNAEEIIVFPNNSNIILAATQAGKYYKDATVHVVNSKSLAQGYSALTVLDTSSGNTEKILAEIDKTIRNVTTCLITYSIRDAVIDELDIKEGDYIGICNGKMVASQKTKPEALYQMLSKIDLEEKEIITIICGNDVTQEEVEEIEAYISSNYENLEIDIIEGKQDVYSYIIAIE